MEAELDGALAQSARMGTGKTGHFSLKIVLVHSGAILRTS